MRLTSTFINLALWVATKSRAKEKWSTRSSIPRSLQPPKKVSSWARLMEPHHLKNRKSQSLSRETPTSSVPRRLASPRYRMETNLSRLWLKTVKQVLKSSELESSLRSAGCNQELTQGLSQWKARLEQRDPVCPKIWWEQRHQSYGLKAKRTIQNKQVSWITTLKIFHPRRTT